MDSESAHQAAFDAEPAPLFSDERARQVDALLDYVFTKGEGWGRQNEVPLQAFFDDYGTGRAGMARETLEAAGLIECRYDRCNGMHVALTKEGYENVFKTLGDIDEYKKLVEGAVEEGKKPIPEIVQATEEVIRDYYAGPEVNTRDLTAGEIMKRLGGRRAGFSAERISQSLEALSAGDDGPIEVIVDGPSKYVYLKREWSGKLLEV